jgi:hypothetical protein
MRVLSTSRLIDRRSLIRSAGATFVAGLLPRKTWALGRADAVFAAAYRDSAGAYGVALLAEDGKILHRCGLPSRGHDAVFDAQRRWLVVFARRPGIFAVAINLTGETAPIVFNAPEGRHYYGHGCFSADGRLLYVTENDYDNARGVIGIYDATADFRHVGELDSGGVGPHDLVPSPDGKRLVIANGGIETHPDFGRAKLNIATMQPNLSILDLNSGEVIGTQALPPEMQKLSIRHIDSQPDGTVWFGCQNQGDPNMVMPLAGCLTRDGDLRLAEIAEEPLRRLRGYVGSVAVNSEAGSFILTSPPGHVAIEVDAKTGVVRRVAEMPDVCGAAAAGGGFTLSSGEGMFAGRQTDFRWDNHIARAV